MIPESMGISDSQPLEATECHLSSIPGLCEGQGHILSSLHPASVLKQGQHMVGVGGHCQLSPTNID